MNNADCLPADDDVTLWLERLKDDDPEAAQRLWNHYSVRLAGVARRKFGPLPRRTYDEEDAAISAFRSFCTGISRRRFLDLDDRDNLWHLLVTITARKVNARRRYEQRARRGGSQVSEVPLYEIVHGDGNSLADMIESLEPTPEFAAEISEQCRVLLAQLDDDEMRHVVLLRFEGYNNTEIAQRLQCTRNRVARKLARVRGLWSEHTEDS